MKLNLVPYPQSLRRLAGSFNLSAGRMRIGGRISEAVRRKVQSLGLKIEHDAAAPALSLALGRMDARKLRVPEKPEAYALRCRREGLAIRAADDDGFFWALVTLQQLLNGSHRIPCVEIRDWPAFGLRYHHDDISRKQVSTVEDFKRIIRMLSYYKINYYTPYMEDTLYLKSHPDIGLGRGRLMPGEVREILAEAKLHHVKVFPTYSLIGHQENLLANRKYRKYAQEVFQSPSSFDPSKPILRPFLRKVIRDVCELFPDSPYFHAGFDETQGVRKTAYIAHANWCAREIGWHGKKMLLWADMFKSHFGLKALHRLRGNIIPVEWQYEDPRAVESAYRKAGIKPLGLGSYKTWCKILPEFDLPKQNSDRWAGMMSRLGGLGMGGSMWGDFGYENSRHLCWNLYAYMAEAAWSGRAKHVSDFEKRFQATFYGKPIPELEKLIVKLTPRRKIPSLQAWQRFRYPFTGCLRLVKNNPLLSVMAQHDLVLYDKMLSLLKQAKQKALREAGQLDHFVVAIERERLLCRRLLLAREVLHGLNGSGLRRALEAHRKEMRRVREHYERIWLRHNKRPNIEVSLAVYDRVDRSIRAFQDQTQPMERYHTLDVGWDSYNADAGGLPVGLAKVHGITFRFPGPEHTHRLITAGRPWDLKCAMRGIRDIHLIYGCLTRRKPTPHQALEVSLRRAGKVVFAQRLWSVKHLCEWADPLGEWIWFGGGWRHVDKSRNHYAMSPGPLYGVMRLSNFKLPRWLVADHLVLRGLCDDEFYLCAATLELNMSPANLVH